MAQPKKKAAWSLQTGKLRQFSVKVSEMPAGREVLRTTAASQHTTRQQQRDGKTPK